jgi:hypothetical protein
MEISGVFQGFDRTAALVAADYTPAPRPFRRAGKEATVSTPTRSARLLMSVAVATLVSAAALSAHNFIGLDHGTLVRARVQSPNAAVTDFPVPIEGTGLSVVCFRVRNTSPFDSRITALGFDLPGELTGFTLISPTDSEFHLIEDVGHVPGLPGVTLDFALTTGRTFAGGRPGAGLAPSSTLTTFCVSGPFPQDVPIERLLDRVVLRVQRVGADGELSDVAIWENRPQ